ncbi:hypothetical protein HZA38_05045 [Candidatus Peregrinibacteria bacterium]|nr:hypothetical protein [Candidatus Peregrinibacteria bacterium]
MKKNKKNFIFPTIVIIAILLFGTGVFISKYLSSEGFFSNLSAETEEKGEIEASDWASKSANWSEHNTDMFTYWANEWLEYEITASEPGLYDIGLLAKNQTSPISDSYNFLIGISVDGNDEGTFEVPVSDAHYNLGSAKVTLPTGSHRIRFTSLRDLCCSNGDMNIRVDKISVNDSTRTAARPLEKSRWMLEDGDIWTAWGNNWLKYGVHAPEDGNYEVGMWARNTKASIPEGYSFHIEVYKNDENTPYSFDIPGHETEYQLGSTTIPLLQGDHQLTFKWTNDYSDQDGNDANIRIKGIFMKKESDLEQENLGLSAPTPDLPSADSRPATPNGFDLHAIKQKVDIAWSDEGIKEIQYFEIEKRNDTRGRPFAKYGPRVASNKLMHVRGRKLFWLFDRSVEPGEMYSYRIRACNAASGGSCSEWTELVSTMGHLMLEEYTCTGNTGNTCSQNNKHAEPTSLTASVTGARTVTLNWVDNSSGEIEFQVERAAPHELPYGFRGFRRTAPNTTSFTDTSIAQDGSQDGSYQYRLRACDGDGCSRWSNDAQVYVGE